MTIFEIDALGRYKFTFENGLFTLTEFKWVFTWKFGATYNGTGKYVTEAGATVKEVYAYLSEHIDVTAVSYTHLTLPTKRIV